MDKYAIGIIGLGYVGLPLAIEFSKKYETIGFDINSKRVEELNNGIDVTHEGDLEDLKNQINQGLKIVSNIDVNFQMQYFHYNRPYSYY